MHLDTIVCLCSRSIVQKQLARFVAGKIVACLQQRESGSRSIWKRGWPVHLDYPLASPSLLNWEKRETAQSYLSLCTPDLEHTVDTPFLRQTGRQEETLRESIAQYHWQ